MYSSSLSLSLSLSFSFSHHRTFLLLLLLPVLSCMLLAPCLGLPACLTLPLFLTIFCHPVFLHTLLVVCLARHLPPFVCGFSPLLHLSLSSSARTTKLFYIYICMFVVLIAFLFQYSFSFSSSFAGTERPGRGNREKPKGRVMREHKGGEEVKLGYGLGVWGHGGREPSLRAGVHGNLRLSVAVWP